MKTNILLCLLILSFNLLFGQKIKFKPLTTKEGLTNNSVKDLISDKDGRLWIATWDGLNIYDGNRISSFKHQQNNPLSIAGNIIIRFQKDKNDTIWMLTNNKSISIYKGNGVFKNYYLENQPKDITLSKTGYLVIIYEKTFFRLDKGKLIPINESEIENSDSIAPLEKYLLKKHTALVINDVLKDDEGNIWYATRKNGLYIIPNTTDNVDNNRIDHYIYDQYSPYSFTSNEIEKLYQDDFGNIWLGHKDGGVSMAYKNSEKITTIIPHPLNFPHLPNETIRAITKDSESKIWLGYYTKGLFFFSNKTKCFLPYTISEAKNNDDLNRIRSLYTDSSGTIWVGTYAGIIRIDKKGYKLYNAEIINAFPDNRNYAFYEDAQKQLWIACWGGLAKFNLTNNAFETYKYQEQLTSFNIRHFIIEEDLIAIATEEKGVLFFDKQKGVIKQITTNEGILGNSIYNIYYDKKTKYYWIATLGGVSIYNLEKGIIKNITEKEGLPSHMVYGLLPNNDKIWISTTKGVAFINKLNYNVSSLSPDQGWQAEEFSEGAAYQDQKGMLYFGGINGLSYLQPNVYNQPNYLPKLKIVINDDENFGSVLKKEYTDNSLTISINSIEFSNTKSPVFYKLEGIDSSWIRLDDDKIFYENIPSGTYNFFTKIRDFEHTKKNVFQLHIEKPFYKTLLFYLSVLVICCLLITLFILRKNIVSKKHQKELENKIIKRTTIIENQKKNLVEVNRNLEEKNKEILNQKETVLALHHQIKNKDFEVDKFKTFVLSSFKPKLSKMLAQIQQLEKTAVSNLLHLETIGLVQLISEWDYLNQVKDLGSLKPSQIHFKNFITNLYEQVHSEKTTTKAVFKYVNNTDTDIIQMDVLRFRLLFQYLLNDILKFTEDNDELTVTCELTLNTILLKVETTSYLLEEEWHNIQQFSPNYKAAEILLNDLEGKLSRTNASSFELSVNIPIKTFLKEEPAFGKVILKHLYQKENISKEIPVTLVLCKEEDANLVYQLVKHDDFQLVFEHDIQSMYSAIQNLAVQSFILYNIPFTHECEQLLKHHKVQQFPVIYIAEQVDFIFEEQALDAGINTVIHLPVSVDFIHKKIMALIHQYQSQYQSKIAILRNNLEKKPILNLQEKIVKQGMEIIKNQLGNSEFNVDKLITALEISRTKCYRVFKKVMHQSPSDIIMNLRLQKAEQLLVLGHLNISEISFECGFNDPKYFSRLFKKHFDESPKSFQKRKTNNDIL